MGLILVIDDDPEMREMISASLEQLGHEVSTCIHPDKADQFLSENKPDLILLDLVFDNHDGLEYLSKLIQRDDSKGLPVIIISAMRQKKKIVEGLKAGAIDYITKPFDVVELKVRVTSALKVYELRDQQKLNKHLDIMKQTAHTVRHEISKPMNDIQRRLIELRGSMEDLNDSDCVRAEDAWKHFSILEEIITRAVHTGTFDDSNGG